MTLSDKFAGRRRVGLFARTLLTMAAFAGGTLVISVALSLLSVELVEGFFPSSALNDPKATPPGLDAPAEDGSVAPGKPRPSGSRLKPGSKAGRLRANDSAAPSPGAKPGSETGE
ncbi:MAG: hypothetical protein EXR75_02820 [Myxococcales bacterium]|nr:hypothetical protein [Myxococcales bacterium]